MDPCEDPGDRPQTEGMVVDSAHGVAHAAQEDVGIWGIPVRADGFGSPDLMDEVRSFGAPQRCDEAAEECVADGPDPGFGGKWPSADAEGLTAGLGRGFREGLLVPHDGERRPAGSGLDATGFSYVKRGDVVR